MNRDAVATAGEFLRQEYESLCRYVYRLVGNRDDALEIVQDTCLRFCESGASADNSNRALLFRIARNLSIDLLRKRNVRRINEGEVERGNVLIMPRDNPEQQLLKQERERLLSEVFESMEERQRECLMLRGSGRSYAEIADVLGLSPESIGPTLGRALRKFRILYEELAQARRVTRTHDSAQRR